MNQLRDFWGRIKIRAYFLGEDVDHVWISEKGDLEEEEHHSWSSMVEEE
jgi:hypothetical protein